MNAVAASTRVLAPSGLTPRALVASVLVAAIVGAALPYVILTLGFGPNVSLLSTFLGFAILSAAGRVSKGSAGSRFELNAVQAAGVAAGQSAFACVALAALDLLRGSGATDFTRPSALVLAAWLASAGCLGVLLSIGTRRHFIDDERLPFAGGAVAGETILVLDDARAAPGNRVAGVTLVVALVGSATVALTGVLRGVLAGVGSGMLLGTRVALSMGVGSVIAAGAGAPRWMTWAAIAMLVAAAVTSLVRGSWLSRGAPRVLAVAAAKDGVAAPCAARWIAAAAALLVLCTVGRALVGVPVWLTLASVVVSLPLLFIGTRVLGETNWAPTTTLAAVAQAALGGLVPGCPTANMLGGAIAFAIPAGGSHMMQSFRAAKVVGATPRDTIFVQLLGAIIGAAAVGLVYPRLVERYGIGPGGLAAPLSATSAALGELFARGADALPPDCALAVAAGAAAGIALALLDRRAFLPAAVPLAIGLMLPLGTGASMAIGGALAWAWRRFYGAGDATHRVPLASGAIAGDAIAAVVTTFLG